MLSNRKTSCTAAVLIGFLTLAVAGAVPAAAASMPSADATPAQAQRDPSPGPHAVEDARHRLDRPHFTPALTTVVPRSPVRPPFRQMATPSLSTASAASAS